MRRHLWRWAQWVAGAAIIGFTARSVLRDWADVRTAHLDWAVTPLPLLGAALLIWGGYAVQTEAWRRMVAGWGYPQPWYPAVRLWLLSSMAKYVPGKVWTLAAMSVMARRRNLPAWAATGSAILLNVLAIATGILVVGLTGFTSPRAPRLEPVVLVVLGTASSAGIGLALWPPATRWLAARFLPGADLRHIPPLGTLGFAVLASVLSWLWYGVAFWLLARGTLPGVPLALGQAIGASTAAYVVGILAVLAPGGLGVREGVLVLLLRDSTGLAGALALAAVSRLGVTLAEVGASIPILLHDGEPRR